MKTLSDDTLDKLENVLRAYEPSEIPSSTDADAHDLFLAVKAEQSLRRVTTFGNFDTGDVVMANHVVSMTRSSIVDGKISVMYAIDKAPRRLVFVERDDRRYILDLYIGSVKYTFFTLYGRYQLLTSEVLDEPWNESENNQVNLGG